VRWRALRYLVGQGWTQIRERLGKRGPDGRLENLEAITPGQHPRVIFRASHGSETSAVVRVDPIDKLVVGFSYYNYRAVVADHAREFFGEGNRGIIGVGERVKRSIH